MDKTSGVSKGVLLASVVAANIGAFGVLASIAKAESESAMSCSQPGACQCIIVHPEFGYCSNNGYPWEPACTKQETCKKDPD